MQFGVLGPLLVQDAKGPVIVSSPKQRALLAILLLESSKTPVRAERLIDELWGARPPATAAKALQVHVSQLRRALEPRQPIVTVPGGYALDIERGALDLHRFELLFAEARRQRAAGDPSGALRSLQEALGLWRGPALADVTLLGPGATEASRLDGLCAVAREERLELELEQGGGASLVPELEALIDSEPYREHLHAMLMLALYRVGRQADALEAYRRVRKLLLEDLGLEPGPELARLQNAILNQDPALDATVTIAAPAPPRAPSIRNAPVPRAASSILGRESELEAGLGLIDRPEVRLVTLTGPGGVGKTRLALELASRMKHRCHFVELAAITAPERVLPAIAAAVGLEDASEEAIALALGGDSAVLLLDNFEQVLAAAPALGSLVSVDAPLTVMVTSRAPLRIAGEHELPVPPLAREFAALLFVNRAQEHDPAFAPNAGDLESINAICDRIDGLPLAIELAAARARLLSPEEILDRLRRRLDLLTAGRRDAPERHRTLRATISWSYDLLAEAEQRLFAQLAVFRSGWSLKACEAVAGEPVVEALAALVEHCLVIREGPRFGMLETVREYALERLDELPDAVEIRQRHAVWCLSIARGAERELEGPKQAEWFERLDLERENLRAAAAWALASEKPEITLELDAALWRFWLARGAVGEVSERLNLALASGRGGKVLRAKALIAAGVLAGEAGDVPGAHASFEEALELAERVGDRRQIARTLMNLGVIGLYSEDYESALDRYAEAGSIWRELGDPRGQSVMCQNMAIVHELQGQFDRAMPLLEESVELARAAADAMHIARTLIEFGNQLVQHRWGDPRIPALLREGLELSARLGEQRQIIEGLEVVAALSARSGAPVTGAELIGAADAERARTAVRRQPDESRLFNTTVRELEHALGPEGYRLAHARGGGMSLASSLAVALESTERVSSAVGAAVR
jgi:predicted ATPase/DNA-binding SARP family transcriptional activator